MGKRKKKTEEPAVAATSDERVDVEDAATETAGEGEDAAPATVEEKLERAEHEAAVQADLALRTLAEFDNYRRRIQRDLTQTRERGAADVLRELLDVADNFDRALEHAGDDVPETFLEGMRLVARGLHDLLDRRGVTRIDAIGAAFDPELHEALTVLPSEDADPNTVLQEIQPGWRMGDRVLRPSKVVVSRAIEVEKDS